MRRGWGSQTGQVTTDSLVIREHLADFALFQLVLLFFKTWQIMDDDTEAAAGISLAQDVEQAEVDAVVQRISALGQVPLVFAGEWNLTADGPLQSKHSPV